MSGTIQEYYCINPLNSHNSVRKGIISEENTEPVAANIEEDKS